MNRGDELFEKGDLKGAIAEYRKALELNPEDSRVHAYLGAALCRVWDSDDAIHHLREATRLNPRDADSYYGLGLAFERKGLLQDALAAYGKAHELEPENEWFRRNYNRLLKGVQGK